MMRWSEMDWSERFQKIQKWLVLAAAALVLGMIAYRTLAPRPEDAEPPDAPIEERRPSGPALSEADGVARTEAPPPSFVPPPPPPTRIVEPPKTSQTVPVRSAAARVEPALMEVPKLALSESAPPRIEDLDAAPHVPTYPAYRLQYNWGGEKLTAEEQTKAINTGLVVNLAAALKVALLKGDETTARAIMEDLVYYGELADKALEVEQLNAKNGDVADAFHRIRQQLERRR